jgi:hypothetical protein
VDKINATTFLEGFCRLVGHFSSPIQLRIDHSARIIEPPPSHTLNTDITLVELFQALKKLQRNKVVGLDGLKAKFILDAGELLPMPLLTTFNCFLAEGFLEALSTRVVHALFKGGDVTRPQLLKGPKYASQVENNGKGRSRNALFNSKH